MQLTGDDSDTGRRRYAYACKGLRHNSRVVEDFHLLKSGPLKSGPFRI